MTIEGPLKGMPVPPPGAHSEATVGASFGTFGEVIQGVLPPDGRDFLVTLPIARMSVATFRPVSTGTMTVVPSFKTKSRLLAQKIVDRFGADGGGILTIDSEIPIGKGMASSSSDLVATARAVCRSFGTDPSPAMIEDLLRDIEPTDGLMYDEVVAFCHRAVRLHARMGPIPPLTILGVDEGGVVDTVEFNGRPKPFDVVDMAEYGRLLRRLTTAIESGDLAELGEIATRSALMNQRLHEKRLLHEVHELCRSAGALGVSVAHSGTKIGILLADEDPDYMRKLHRIVLGLRGLSSNVSVDRTVSSQDLRERPGKWSPASFAMSENQGPLCGDRFVR
ncbi:hypothetical protein [Spirillospora sp. CA-294931]|uniref:GHMP family kinase ATP-binding protein n=1 Tax=Spirillospora sp. CA-294931 TaxID=3240042 RepID=UPI003D8A7897